LISTSDSCRSRKSLNKSLHLSFRDGEAVEESAVACSVTAPATIRILPPVGITNARMAVDPLVPIVLDAVA
jgi:hypothetical protein